MSADLDDTKLLTTDSKTVFRLDDSGRILHENEPEKSEGPRMCVLRGSSKTLAFARHDVSDLATTRIEEIAKRETWNASTETTHVHLDEYRQALGNDVSSENCSDGIIFCVSRPVEFVHEVTTIDSGSPEAAELVANLNGNGMPQPLLDLGFRTPEDFWPPWSIAIRENAIISIGFTARLGSKGAEAGVVTIPEERGNGYAPAAVTAWTSHPELAGKSLFYSVLKDNTGSLRVAEKLGFRQIGTSLRIT